MHLGSAISSCGNGECVDDMGNVDYEVYERVGRRAADL